MKPAVRVADDQTKSECFRGLERLFGLPNCFENINFYQMIIKSMLQKSKNILKYSAMVKICPCA
jgi:hypothetical protein